MGIKMRMGRTKIPKTMKMMKIMKMMKRMKMMRMTPWGMKRSRGKH